MELEDATTNGHLWDGVDGGPESWAQGPPEAKITSVMSMLWHQLLSALSHLHFLNVVHCDVKVEFGGGELIWKIVLRKR